MHTIDFTHTDNLLQDTIDELNAKREQTVANLAYIDAMLASLHAAHNRFSETAGLLAPAFHPSAPTAPLSAPLSALQESVSAQIDRHLSGAKPVFLRAAAAVDAGEE